jgi:hypothetical protein
MRGGAADTDTGGVDCAATVPDAGMGAGKGSGGSRVVALGSNTFKSPAATPPVVAVIAAVAPAAQ